MYKLKRIAVSVLLGTAAVSVLGQGALNVKVDEVGALQATAVTTSTGVFVVNSYDSATETRISGAEFILTDGTGKIVAVLTTGATGEARTTMPVGTYTLKQRKATAGYAVDTTTQNITIEAGGTTTSSYYNVKAAPTTGVFIVKISDTTTGAGISGAEFILTNGTGKIVAVLTTGLNGEAKTTMPVGAYTLKQRKTASGYGVDTREENINVVSGGTTTATYYNSKMAQTTGVFVVKAYDTTTGAGISGAEFILTDTSGKIVAVLTTGATGEAKTTMPVGTYTLKQRKTAAGYAVDATTQNITIAAGGTTSSSYYNTKAVATTGSFVVRAYDSTTKAPLAGVEFILTDGTGKIVAVLTTGATGEAKTTMPAGTYTLKQRKAPTDYTIDTRQQVVTIASGGTAMASYYNSKTSSTTGVFVVKAYDTETKSAVAGAEFILTDPSGKIVAVLTTGATGEARTTMPVGTYTLKQRKAPTGYTLNNSLQTVNVAAGGTFTSSYSNTKISTVVGSVIIKSYDINTNAPLAGVEYSVVDSTGKVVAVLTSGATGEVRTTVPAGSYQIKQTKVPAGRALNKEPQSFTIVSSSTVTATFYN